MRRTLFLTAIFLISARMASGEGLSTLIEVGKGQQEINKVLESETEVFNKVQSGIESGDIKTGTGKDEIVKRYGEPVVSLKESNGTDRWVYKPASSSYFEGVKIYLFFDKDGILNDIKTVEQKKGNK